MASRRKSRILAVQALFSWDFSKTPVEELLRFDWVDNPKSDDSLVFSRLLVAGTIENIEAVDAVIEKNLEHWEMSRVGRIDLAILRLSTYSLLYQDNIPERVTIDEAIDIAKEFGSDDSYRFINGVLDAIRKNRAS